MARANFRQNMSSFYRIDFFRAALQVRGASAFEIEHLLDGIRKLGGSEFEAWNHPMNEEDEKVLALMLGPEGSSLAVYWLEGFKTEMLRHYGISLEELEKWLKPRSKGLN